MPKNYYPDKPRGTFKATTVSMPTVISYLASAKADKEVKRMAYVMFRNESANGAKGINNNYCGFQADSGRWDKRFDDLISGTVTLKENQTGKERVFLCFHNVGGCLEMLLDRVKGRGLYIGGTTWKIVKMPVKTPTDLATAYQREWVKGNPKAVPSEQELKNFLSMYKQATAFFI